MAALCKSLLLSLFVTGASIVSADAIVNASHAAARQSKTKLRGPLGNASSAKAVGGNVSAKVDHNSPPAAAPKAEAAKKTTHAVPKSVATSMVSLRPQAGKRQEPAQEPAAPAPGSDAVSQLQQETQELRQRQANILQMQRSLTAEVALLREGSVLRRVSATRHGQTAAQVQVRKTERLVKELSSMLRESRADATEDAKALRQEATQVRAAADELAKEASAQLRALAAKPVERRSSTPLAAKPTMPPHSAVMAILAGAVPATKPAVEAPAVEELSAVDQLAAAEEPAAPVVATVLSLLTEAKASSKPAALKTPAPVSRIATVAIADKEAPWTLDSDSDDNDDDE